MSHSVFSGESRTKKNPILYSRSILGQNADNPFVFDRAVYLDDLLSEVRHKLLTLAGGLITQANIIELTELIR